MPEPRAVVFDLGGTLWYWPRRDPTRDGAWFWGQAHDHAVQALPNSVALTHADRESFARAMVASETAYRRRARTEGRSQTPREIAADGFRRLGNHPCEEELAAALDGYGRAGGGWVTPFPDVASTLSWLRGAGYRIGALSNTWWSSRWLDEDLRNLGLADLFDAVLYTSDLPHTKPHPAVFLETARRLDTEPAACVMVGDDPLCDVFGARRAGMKSVWKRGGGSSTDYQSASPDASVVRLSELPALLDRGFG